MAADKGTWPHDRIFLGSPRCEGDGEDGCCLQWQIAVKEACLNKVQISVMSPILCLAYRECCVSILHVKFTYQYSECDCIRKMLGDTWGAFYFIYGKNHCTSKRHPACVNYAFRGSEMKLYLLIYNSNFFSPPWMNLLHFPGVLRPSLPLLL